MDYYSLLLTAIRTQAVIAQCECICTTRLPVCLLNEDGSRAWRQPYVYQVPSQQQWEGFFPACATI